jgi:carbon storage regulator
MLVLSRRLGDEIVIGENVRVTVTAVMGNRVAVGIEAPSSVKVDRKEIHDRRTEAGAGTLKNDKVG